MYCKIGGVTFFRKPFAKAIDVRGEKSRYIVCCDHNYNEITLTLSLEEIFELAVQKYYKGPEDLEKVNQIVIKELQSNAKLDPWETVEKDEVLWWESDEITEKMKNYIAKTREARKKVIQTVESSPEDVKDKNTSKGWGNLFDDIKVEKDIDEYIKKSTWKKAETDQLKSNYRLFQKEVINFYDAKVTRILNSKTNKKRLDSFRKRWGLHDFKHILS